MAEASLVATRVQTLVTTNGETAGIIGRDGRDNQVTIGMDSSLAVRAITEWLQGFYEAGGYQPIETRTTSAPLHGIVPYHQAVLAIGEDGSPLLRLVMGAAVLNFHLGSSQWMRKLATQLLDMAPVIEAHERGLPRQ